tara:strand:- start:2199 stop:3098 length:900 start_codon:yes stop_codon:yes gene_type:complete
VFATVFLTMHQSGLTSKPSTASRGVALWIASLAATRASHSPTRAVEKGRTIPDTSGPISGESFLKSNHDSASLKTWLDTFRLVLNQYGETFAIWATRLKQDSLRRQKLAPHISGSGSLSWRTPTDESKHGGTSNPIDIKRKGQTVHLGDQASHWPTPTKSDDGGKVTVNSLQSGLIGTASKWRTPMARGWKDGADLKEKPVMTLGRQTQNWGTPTGRDANEGYNPKLGRDGTQDGLLGRQAPQHTMPGQKFYASKRALNPRFVEWLMGFPIGWTDLQPLETLSFQRWQQQHGDNLERRQ